MAYRSLAVVVCTYCFLIQTTFGISYLLTGVVEQLNDSTGEPTYIFSLNLVDWLANPSDISLEIVSPNGVRFSETTTLFNNVAVRLDGILQTEINNAVSGAWTIEETINGTQLNQYQFTVPPILGSNKFPRIPVITSPLDGSTVGPIFDVTWTNPMLGSLSYSIQYAGGVSLPPPDTDLNAPGNATFSYLGISGFSGADVSRLSIVTSSSTNELLPVTPMNPEGTSTFTNPSGLAGLFTYKTFSPPISFTIVPEVTTDMYMMMAGLLGICFVRRI